MDHGFAPGLTNFDLQYRNLLANRATTTLDTTAYPPPVRVKTVAAFWTHLKATAAKPIGDVLLISHGNETGDMALKLIGTGRTDYEELLRIQATQADADAVKLPDELRQSSPGMPPLPRKIHIRGCLVGQDTKYMNRLQDVLGNKVAVTAPLHLAGLQALLPGKRHVADPPSHGYLEFLMYEFEVRAKTAITDRALLVDAFKKARHKFIDRVQVPDALWDQWVPAKSFNAAASPITMPPLALNAVIESTDPTVKLPKLKVFWSDGAFKHYTFPMTVKIAAATEPKAADHRALILTELRKSTSFSRADHPFQEQWRFASLEAMVDALSWTPTYSRRKQMLTMVGIRHSYAAEIHLCDPAVGAKDKPDTWQLIYNFYPLRTLPINAIERMAVTDARLFFTAVP